MIGSSLATDNGRLTTDGHTAPRLWNRSQTGKNNPFDSPLSLFVAPFLPSTGGGSCR